MSDEIGHIIHIKVKDLAATFAKSLDSDDPVVTTWLSTQLAMLAVILQHAPPQFSVKVVITLLDTLPDRVVAEVVKQYLERLAERYRASRQ